MTHAAQAIHNREAGIKTSVQFKHHQPPPPPYPIAQDVLAASPAVTATVTATAPATAISSQLPTAQSVCLQTHINIYSFLSRFEV